MKKFTLILCVFVLSMVSLTSCSDVEPIDPDIVLNPQPNPGPEPDPDCIAPEGFQASAFIGNNVNLSWVAGGDETEWEIEYGADGFTVGSGTTISSANTNYTVGGLTATNNYDFYVRSICGDESFSSWVGPVSVNGTTGPGPNPVGFQYMNATVNGVSYTSMKPYFYTFTGFEPSIESYDIASGPTRVMKIQGHSDPLSNGLENFVEINLYLKEDFWAVGTYPMAETNASSWDDSQSEANLIIVQGTNTFSITENELGGTLTVTEFSEANMRIKGTFSFTYMLSDNGVQTGPFAASGTFDYPLSPDVFD